jgi:hypothetical protein
MKLINMIKNAFVAGKNAAVATAKGTGTISNGDGAKNLTLGHIPNHVRSVTPMTSTAIMGEVTPEHLSSLRSERGKQAVASLGCWSALAKGFNQFMRTKQEHPSRQDWTKVYQHLAEFHSWNAACCEKSSGYFVRQDGDAYGENLGFAMSEEEVEITIAKLAILPMPKGDDKTDAILAKVRGCTVEILRKEREDDINLRSSKRLELVQEFCQMVWACSSDDPVEVSIPMAKVLNKLGQTLQWIANWKLDPAAAASECLLLQDDIETLSKISSKDVDRDSCHDQYFVNGMLTADGMMKQSPF